LKKYEYDVTNLMFNYAQEITDVRSER